MKKTVVSLVKYFGLIYNLYFYICSGFINILRHFVKSDDKLILFNSFGGKKYDDSPRAIYETMLSDKRFNNYKFIWAFHEPKNFSVPGAEKVKTDTFTYFKIALKARCWITNSSIERDLNFKGKKTFYFNTWHGTPIKYMGMDVSSSNKSFTGKGQHKFDEMTSQSEYETNIFSRVFNIPRERFLMCGLPRNDRLTKYTESEKSVIRKKFNVPEGKKIILYAPTFREYERDNTFGCILSPPVDLEKWERALGDKYCLLFRAHYEVVKIMNMKENDFIKDVSNYPELNDLMIATDILISDYSSIFFDFSIMDKIMLHCREIWKVQYENRREVFHVKCKKRTKRHLQIVSCWGGKYQCINHFRL